MTILNELFVGPELPPLQREYIRKEISELLSKCTDKNKAITSWMYWLLQTLSSDEPFFQSSLRSGLLEKFRDCAKNGQIDEAKIALSILVAMYNDIHYINANQWYDFELNSKADLPIQERVFLCTMATVLEIKEIPDMSEWPRERILSFIAN